MAKKPDPRIALAQPVAPAQPTVSPLSEDEAWWAEDPRREQALQLLLSGSNKSLVARSLEVHRNTIDNWCKDHRFADEMGKRAREHISAKRQQRLRGTNLVNDINERVTIALGRKVEEILRIDERGKPRVDEKELEKSSFDKMFRRYREASNEFRETREHERIDIGDDVKRVDVTSNTKHTITGDVHVMQHGVNETSFTDYVRKALDTKVINVNAIEVKPNEGEGQLLLKAAEHLLVDTDLLDQINAEDMAAEEASKK